MMFERNPTGFLGASAKAIASAEAAKEPVLFGAHAAG